MGELVGLFPMRMSTLVYTGLWCVVPDMGGGMQVRFEHGSADPKYLSEMILYSVGPEIEGPVQYLDNSILRIKLTLDVTASSVNR